MQHPLPVSAFTVSRAAVDFSPKLPSTSETWPDVVPVMKRKKTFSVKFFIIIFIIFVIFIVRKLNTIPERCLLAAAQPLRGFSFQAIRSFYFYANTRFKGKKKKKNLLPAFTWWCQQQSEEQTRPQTTTFGRDLTKWPEHVWRWPSYECY